MSEHLNPTDTKVSTSSRDHDQSRPGWFTRSLSSRLLVSVLFWGLCLTLSAAGHRLYKAIVTLDRAASAEIYQLSGVPILWVGHGELNEAHWRVSGENTLQTVAPLCVLPNSSFWVGSALTLTLLGGLMAWAGRWIPNTGVQSMVGLFAGHLLWLGTIELGLDIAGRRLGLAASLEIVGDRIVGTHSAGTLIQLSVVFLIPILIGLTMHESNRCAIFQWFRRRLPNVFGPAPSGRVENYAARTANQFFMTVWFCYVGVLWLADPVAGPMGHVALVLVFVLIVVATPYMIWRTAAQSSEARAFRYSVSGAVVGWTAVEIAASMNLFDEPWLSTSLVSGVYLLALSIVLTGLAVRFLAARVSRTLISRPVASATLAMLLGITAGCSDQEETAVLSAAEIDRRLDEYDASIDAPPERNMEGLLRALTTADPKIRAQAAIAVGKSTRVSQAVQDRLKVMAESDESRLAQHAAIQALDSLGLLSPQLQTRLSHSSGSE